MFGHSVVILSSQYPASNIAEVAANPPMYSTKSLDWYDMPNFAANTLNMDKHGCEWENCQELFPYPKLIEIKPGSQNTPRNPRYTKQKTWTSSTSCLTWELTNLGFAISLVAMLAYDSPFRGTNLRWINWYKYIWSLICGIIAIETTKELIPPLKPLRLHHRLPFQSHLWCPSGPALIGPTARDQLVVNAIAHFLQLRYNWDDAPRRMAGWPDGPKVAWNANHLLSTLGSLGCFFGGVIWPDFWPVHLRFWRVELGPSRK